MKEFGEIKGTTVTVDVAEWKAYVADLDAREKNLADGEKKLKENEGKIKMVIKETSRGWTDDYVTWNTTDEMYVLLTTEIRKLTREKTHLASKNLGHRLDKENVARGLRGIMTKLPNRFIDRSGDEFANIMEILLRS